MKRNSTLNSKIERRDRPVKGTSGKNSVKVDKSQIGRAVDALYRNADSDGLVWLKTFGEGRREVGPSKATKIGPQRKILVRELDELARWADRQKQAYVVCPPVATFKSGKNAKESNLANGLVIAIDLDVEPARGLNTLRKVFGKPTLVQQSGGGFRCSDGRVEKKLHVYFRLANPTRTAEEHALLKECLQMATAIAGGDETATSIVHPLRAAGTTHRKNLKRPKLARIVECNSERQIDLRVAHRRLVKAGGVAGTKAVAAASPAKRESKPIAEQSTAALTRKILTGSDYHGPLVQLAMHYIMAGMSETSTLDVLRGHMEAVPKSKRDLKGGTTEAGRWQARYDNLPSIVSSAVLKAESDDGWPAMEPLPTALLPVPKMTEDMLPRKFRRRLAAIAKSMQLPLEYAAIPALVAAGAAVGRQVGVQPKPRNQSWIEVPNHYACIVGRPGIKKTPAMRLAMAPLQALEDQAQVLNKVAEEKYRHEFAQYDFRRKALESKARKVLGQNPKADVSAYVPKPPTKPQLRRHIVVDATPQRLGEVIAENPNGVLYFRDELMPLWKTLENDNNSLERGMFLSGWDGHTKLTVDRIGRGHVNIGAVCLSMVGSTQPERLVPHVHGIFSGKNKDDGLLQRFLFVWPDISKKWKSVDIVLDGETEARAGATFRRLRKLQLAAIGAEMTRVGVPVLKFSPAAQRIFDHWEKGHERRLRAGELPSAMLAHLSKYPKLVAGHALLFHLIDHKDGGPIGTESIELAIRWAKHLEAHACRVYGGAMRNDVEAAKLILKKIKEGKLTGPFSERYVRRAEWGGVKDLATIKQALQVLWDCHMVRRKPKGKSFEYEINPQLTKAATQKSSAKAASSAVGKVSKAAK